MFFWGVELLIIPNYPSSIPISLAHNSSFKLPLKAVEVLSVAVYLCFGAVLENR
tara:strand:+ start:219 stop:380 length:162 start_codon:yes stop_codon:yes gene_type:complete